MWTWINTGVCSTKDTFQSYLYHTWMYRMNGTTGLSSMRPSTVWACVRCRWSPPAIAHPMPSSWMDMSPARAAIRLSCPTSFVFKQSAGDIMWRQTETEIPGEDVRDMLVWVWGAWVRVSNAGKKKKRNSFTIESNICRHWRKLRDCIMPIILRWFH